MGPMGFTDYSKYQREQDKRADANMRSAQRELLEGVYNVVHNPKKDAVIGALLREASARQRALVRAHLQKQIDQNNRYGATIEAGCVECAIKAFDRGEYDHGHIARHLGPEAIERIFG